MILLSFENIEEMIKDIQNGYIQHCIYEYLEKLYEDDIYKHDHKLNRENVFEYFEAQFDNLYISYEQIQKPCSEVEIILNSIILLVYERWKFDTLKKGEHNE